MLKEYDEDLVCNASPVVFQIHSILRQDCLCDAVLTASSSELTTDSVMPVQKNPRTTSTEVLECILIG